MTGSPIHLGQSFQAARDDWAPPVGPSVRRRRVASVVPPALKDPPAVPDGGGLKTGRRKAAPPFSLRLSFEERARLEREAGDVPLGAYIRWRLFGDGQDRAGPSGRPPRQRRRRVLADEQALAQLLAKLGDTRLANNLNQLAKAANAGSLPVMPETEQALRDAHAEVRAMRQLLLRALGFREPGS